MREAPNRRMRTTPRSLRMESGHDIDAARARSFHTGKGLSADKAEAAEAGGSAPAQAPVQRSPRGPAPAPRAGAWDEDPLTLQAFGFDPPIQRKPMEETPGPASEAHQRDIGRPDPIQLAPRSEGRTSQGHHSIQRKRTDDDARAARIGASEALIAGPSAPQPALGPIQARNDDRASAMHDGSARQAAQASGAVASGGGELPHREQIQASFGRHDVSGVRAFVGGNAGQQARAIGASAYATGDAVAFSDSPSLHTAAHEAAHVVQQRAGVVALKGINPSGSVHERHADAVADAVVAGRSAQPLLDSMPGGGGASAHMAIQRGPETPSEVLKDPLIAADTLPAPQLDPTDLTLVREDAKFRMLNAKGNFYDAANGMRSAIETRAKQNMEFACLVIDVAFGLLLPGLGTGIAKIANGLPVRSPNLIYRLTLPLTDEALARALIQNSQKVGTTVLKNHATEIAGLAPSSLFITWLKDKFSIGIDKIQHHLNRASQLELVAVWAAFDPSIMSTQRYLVSLAEIVGHFQQQVEPIHAKTEEFDPDFLHAITNTTHAFYVADEGGTKRLAILRKEHWEATSALGTTQTQYDFVEWVTPDMQSVVLKRTEQVGGEPVEVPPGQITGLRPHGTQP